MAGDPAYAEIEQRLSRQPVITVPSITFDGADDGVRSPSRAGGQGRFRRTAFAHRVIPGVGRTICPEAPDVFAQAVLQVVVAGGSGSDRPGVSW